MILILTFFYIHTVITPLQSTSLVNALPTQSFFSKFLKTVYMTQFRVKNSAASVNYIRLQTKIIVNLATYMILMKNYSARYGGKPKFVLSSGSLNVVKERHFIRRYPVLRTLCVQTKRLNCNNVIHIICIF